MIAQPLMFTHYKCGGNLVEIPDPPWFLRPPGHLSFIVFAKCDRCGLCGEVMSLPLDTEQVSV